MEYQFSAQSADADSKLAGSIEISRRQLIAKLPIETTRLQAENTVSAGLWDTFVTVTVHAEQDLVITSGGRLPGKSLLLVLLLALFVIGLAGLAFFLTN